MVPEEERAHGTISAKTYFMFFKEGVKSNFLTIILLLFFVLVDVCVLCTYIYVGKVIISRLTIVSRVAKKNSLRDVYQESIIRAGIAYKKTYGKTNLYTT